MSHFEFEYDGTQYTAETLFITTASGVGTPLRISFHPEGETVFNTDDFFLYVDGTAFAFSDATFTSGHFESGGTFINGYFEWANSGLNWSPADTVEVRLVDTPPTLSSAEVQVTGAELLLTFSEDLDIATQVLPAAVVGAFSVTADGLDVAISAVTATAEENVLSITLQSPAKIGQGQTVTISYDKTAAGTDALEDAAENEVASFTDFAVTNNSTVDTTPPSPNSAFVVADGTSIQLKFDEALDCC